MKKLLLLLFILPISCQTISYMSNQEYVEKSNDASFVVENDQMLLEVSIDGTKIPIQQFFFDTGAGMTILRDSTIFKNFAQIPKAKFGSAKLPDQKISLENAILNYSTSFYEGKNIVTAILIPENNLCSTTKVSGIIGNSYFVDEEKIINLNFDTKKINKINNNEVEQFAKNNHYQFIKSEFFRFGSHFKIFLKVGEVEESFHFDTGNSAAPLILAEKSKITMAQPKLFYGSMLGSAIKKISYENKTEIDNNKAISLGETTIDAHLIKSTFYTSDYNNVGLPFIKKFNWIIDYKNKKIYFKKNNDESDISTFTKISDYKVQNINNELIVLVKSEGAKKYNLKDVILSVDGVTITNENRCTMRDKLNYAKNWNDFTLKMKKK